VSNFFLRATQSLRLRGPLAADPTARTLHALLAGILAFDMAVYLVERPFSPNKPATMATFFPLVAALIVALVLLGRGRLRQAILTYLSAMWFYATGVTLIAGGIHTFGVVYYLALPILAAWLLGYRAALWNVGLSLISALLFAIAETVGMWRFPTPMAFGAWFHVSQATIVAAVPVAHMLQSLRGALSNSRRAQDELQGYKQHLEDLVERRTAELLRARDQATAARDQAEAANRAKSVFLANVSHELRTPLNAILGFSDLLRRSSISDAQRKNLEIVHRSGEHLLGLINDVLDLAKVEAGHAVLEMAACDLESLVRSVTEMMRVRAHEKGLEMRVTAEPGFPRFIQTDAAKLRQVLINLLGNGIKYTDRGSVALRLASRPAGETGRVVVILEVADTGIGIAAADHTRVFDPFVQVGEARRGKGTGLGLTITRQFVELMGGSIGLESMPGLGSCFHVELPVALAQESEVEETAEPERRVAGLEQGQAEYRILIVEDERENWLLLERLLESAGFQTRVAEDGAAGVEIFREWHPHLIWMDVRMPVMDGVEATRRIRALDGGREVKIAAVTASAFVSERDELLAAGMDDFVRKPYRSAEIFACMGRQLGVRYRYSDVAAIHSEEEAVLRPEALAALPRQLRRELADAAVSLRPERILAAIDRVREIDQAVADVLSRLSDRLAYTSIYDAIAISEAGEVRQTAGNSNQAHPT